LTTRRYTQSQLQAVANDPCSIARCVRLMDKFGDNGLIAVLFGHCPDQRTFLIDTWLMSCRVPNRGVEDLLLRHLLAELQHRCIPQLVGEYIPTRKNGLVRDLYRNFGIELLDTRADGRTRWGLDLTCDAALE